MPLSADVTQTCEERFRAGRYDEPANWQSFWDTYDEQCAQIDGYNAAAWTMSGQAPEQHAYPLPPTIRISGLESLWLSASHPELLKHCDAPKQPPTILRLAMTWVPVVSVMAVLQGVVWGFLAGWIATWFTTSPTTIAWFVACCAVILGSVVVIVDVVTNHKKEVACFYRLER